MTGPVVSVLLGEFGDIHNGLKAGMWASDNADGEQIMVVLLIMNPGLVV